MNRLSCHYLFNLECMKTRDQNFKTDDAFLSQTSFAKNGGVRIENYSWAEFVVNYL